ncbi:MAG TPA: GNAT family N-acetyltransferase [Ktedonobacterales bacterium]|nr:GNAT family N-acetyltransferase [Ktedonobacterales bacterium]
MLNIRRYQSSDSDIVWKLHNDAMVPTGAHLGNDSWYDDVLHIDEVYLQNGGEYLVGEYDGQVVAMGGLKRTTAERAEVKRMRVAPEYQRHGFGQAMLEAIEQRAKELGYATLHLDTGVTMLAAQGLYRKNGYQEVSRGTIAEVEVIFFEKRINQG